MPLRPDRGGIQEGRGADRREPEGGWSEHAAHPLGEAATTHKSATDKVSAFTGREFTGITGAGATKPLAGAGRAQTIPDPPWVIFGHEVCGHARLQAGGMPPTFIGHATTPEGTQTTVDVENRIRREHSTVAASLGMRGGAFRAKTGGAFAGHSGAVYRVAAGETLAKIATRCGIAGATMLAHIWRSDGSEITAADKDTLAAGEELLVEGIDWHEVIAGETMASIAKIWNIPLASLTRANPQVTGPSFTIRVGDRLMIPAT
jgi:LysM repeat protein